MYQYKSRHIDKEDQIEDPDITPHMNEYLIFDKNKKAQNTHWGKKRQHLHQMVLIKLDGYMQKKANRSEVENSGFFGNSDMSYDVLLGQTGERVFS